jgi:hypothetical protein
MKIYNSDFSLYGIIARYNILRVMVKIISLKQAKNRIKGPKFMSPGRKDKSKNC